MVTIKYRILPIDKRVSPQWRTERAIDFSAVSEMDLRYEYFWSSINFVVDETDIGSYWGSLTLLDFVASMNRAKRAIGSNSEAIVGFTENADTVSFVRAENKVRIGYETAGLVITCDLRDLLLAIDRFTAEVIGDLGTAYPELRRNEFFVGLANGL